MPLCNFIVLSDKLIYEAAQVCSVALLILSNRNMIWCKIWCLDQSWLILMYNNIYIYRAWLRGPLWVIVHNWRTGNLPPSYRKNRTMVWCKICLSDPESIFFIIKKCYFSFKLYQGNKIKRLFFMVSMILAMMDIME